MFLANAHITLTDHLKSGPRLKLERNPSCTLTLPAVKTTKTCQRSTLPLPAPIINPVKKNALLINGMQFWFLSHPLSQPNRLFYPRGAAYSDYRAWGNVGYGVWVSVSEKSFNDYQSYFHDNPENVVYFGMICNWLPLMKPTPSACTAMSLPSPTTDVLRCNCIKVAKSADTRLLSRHRIYRSTGKDRGGIRCRLLRAKWQTSLYWTKPCPTAPARSCNCRKPARRRACCGKLSA